VPISADSAGQAKNEIFSFIEQMLEVLNKIIREPYGPEGRFILKEMLRALKEAWAEFQDDFELKKAEKQVFSVSAQSL
jgi:hypothetical protein